MISMKPEDSLHRMHLYRLLSEIADNHIISQNIYFKGGTCASMLGYLDRFSIDLDFDIKNKGKSLLIDRELRKIFNQLDLELKQKSKNELFYVVKYQSAEKSRNSIKISIMSDVTKSNIYVSQFFQPIDRYLNCQTIETMFSHKLISLTDRYKKYKTIAGRDLYDIHYFFLQGYRYNPKIIKERTKKDIKKYLTELIVFIEKKVTDEVINQDLNNLLPYERFSKIRKILKKETIMMIKNEIASLRSQ
jgi:predicted nucleotidyltransferase component of viral defense system